MNVLITNISNLFRCGLLPTRIVGLFKVLLDRLYKDKFSNLCRHPSDRICYLALAPPFLSLCRSWLPQPGDHVHERVGLQNRALSEPSPGEGRLGFWGTSRLIFVELLKQPRQLPRLPTLPILLWLTPARLPPP